MKLLLINPRFPESFWTFKWATEAILPSRRAVNPPLGLATVAALSPDHWEVEIVDENIESIPLAPRADIIGICGMGLRPRQHAHRDEHHSETDGGHAPADVLAEKRVDAALLCVGNYEQVPDQPGAILQALSPRYAIGGHWENFFQPQDQPLQPIPFLNVDTYSSRGDAIMGSSGEAPVIVDGQSTTKRHFVPNPGTVFAISRAQP